MAGRGYLLGLTVLLGVGASLGWGDNQPLNCGILRLTRDWHWGEAAAVNRSRRSTGSGETRLPVEVLQTSESGALDLDRLPLGGKRGKNPCDRYLWVRFQAPESWRNRLVWLSYDILGLGRWTLEEVWLNDERVRVALPVTPRWARNDPDPNYWGAWSVDPGSTVNDADWFTSIGSRLRYDRENVIALRVKGWPRSRTTGIWLYSPPRSERVLFLESADVPDYYSGKIGAYIKQVQRNFSVEPLCDKRSFASPEALRAYLQTQWRECQVGGAVLIGNHPRATYKSADGDKGACPQFYEELDAQFFDTDGDGSYDRVEQPGHYRSEIWTSWIRAIPTRPEFFGAFLDKLLGYYGRQFYYPFRQWQLGAGNPGIRGIDKLLCGADLWHHLGHGGLTFEPHTSLQRDDFLHFYPSALIADDLGCHAADITGDDFTNAEAFLFGRGNTICCVSGAKNEGWADLADRVWAGNAAAGRVAGHWGVYHLWRSDLRNDHVAAGDILLGDPFASLTRDLRAPAQTVHGRVSAAVGALPPYLYISATRKTKYRGSTACGRTPVGLDGTFEFECLPPGDYEIRLHLNLFESLVHEVTVKPQTASRISLNYKVENTWRISGRVLGKKDAMRWVEMAPTGDDKGFARRELQGVFAENGGENAFAIVGIQPRTFWLRGCLLDDGKARRSLPVKVEIGAGEQRTGLLLRVQ